MIHSSRIEISGGTKLQERIVSARLDPGHAKPFMEGHVTSHQKILWACHMQALKT